MRSPVRSFPLVLAVLGLAAAFVAVPTAAVPAPVPGEYYFTSFFDESGSGSVEHVIPAQQAAVSSGGQFTGPYDVINVPGVGLIAVDPDAAGGNGALIRVDPLTGAQTVISSGQFFRDPLGVVRAEDGSYLVVDPSASAPEPVQTGARLLGPTVEEGPGGPSGAVIRVHPTTGVQTLVSSGQFFIEPLGIALEPSGSILVTDSYESDGVVIRINPTNGVQSIVSSSNLLNGPVGIAVSSTGAIYVADPWAERVLQVDPTTGAQTDITPSPSPFAFPWGIDIGSEGDLYVSDDDMVGTGVIRLDPQTKDFFVIGSGNLLADPAGLTFAEDGAVLVADTDAFGDAGGIIRLTPPVQTQVSAGGLLKNPGGIVHTPLGLFVAVSQGLNGGGGVVKVDPITGAQTPITTGGELHTAAGITYSPDGNLYVTDLVANQAQGSPAIIRVNPTTGVQTVVVRGGGLVFPFGIVAEANGMLLVTDDHEAASDSGNTSAQGAFANGVPIPQVLRSRFARRGAAGVGPAAEDPPPTGFVLRVNPNTGAITPLSALNAPTGICLDRNGNALVTAGLFFGAGGADVFRVNTTTGAVAPISVEPTLHIPFGVAEAPDGSVLASDFSFFQFPGAIQRFAAGNGAPSTDISYERLVWPFGITMAPAVADAPPTLTSPGPIRVEQDSLNGATVNYEVEASDDEPGVTVVCSHLSGSVFPLGTTTVTCTATDSVGQTATVQFTVTVVAPTSSFYGRVFAAGDLIGAGPRRRIVGMAQNRNRTTHVGQFTFSLDGGRTVVVTRQITAVVINGTQARVFGKATVNRRGTYDFAAIIDDLGAPGSRKDRVRIQVSNGIDTSGQLHGDVRVLLR